MRHAPFRNIRQSQITNLKHWIVFSFLEVILIFLEKNEVSFPFSGMQQTQ